MNKWPMNPNPPKDSPPTMAPEERPDVHRGSPHKRSPQRLFRFAVGIVVVLLGLGISVYWFSNPEKRPTRVEVEDQPPSLRSQDQDMASPPTKSAHEGMTMPSPVSETSTQPEAPETVMVSARKQQMMGVRTEKAEIIPLTHTIRTVALVAVDERRLVHVNIKLEGWVEKLYVQFTGEKVRKDQMLFEIYSPELVSSQEEYLLALKAVRTLEDSEFPAIAESAHRVLQSTEERFALWDITPDHIVDLERTGKVLRTLPLHSPISGYVLKMNVREGEYITPATEAYTLADLSNIWVLADLYEFEIPFVKLGQKAQITLPYFPNEIFKGTVTYIYPVLDPKTRTVKVQFELPNPDWKLKPDMFANVNMQISLGERLVVPSTAVLDSGTKQVVFVDEGRGMFEARNVALGVRTRDWYEIREGVKPGEMVVTSGNFLIDSESSLKAATSMMMPGMDMGSKEKAGPSSKESR
ncbi:MAG: efflux RND transporter periplasmic adaptor subunit, partial [Nitrospira sp.]|nr:efflux RND transporter periplasmic adaptor subunit [Nitrospira sp.]